MYLDGWGIYGSDIYVLYSDLCKRDIPATAAVIRAAQLGIVDSDRLAALCAMQDYSICREINLEEVKTKIKERLPDFFTVPENN